MVKFIQAISFPKLVGRFGILAVDTFSTLIFFMLQGDSWVLSTTGFIFAFTKVWHWQQSFKTADKLKRFLHRGAWLLMAILSIYFLITLGLSITQAPPEEVIDQNTAALEEAIARSRVANIEALSKEQDSLLRQNEGLTERLLALNQWSQAWGPIQTQLGANLARLGIITAELNKVYAEQNITAEAEDTQKEKEETAILKFKPVKPIGAHSLMARVMPDNWIDASIVILFFLIGIVMEITLALSSLSEEKRLHYQPEKDPENEKKNDRVPLPAREEPEPPAVDRPSPEEIITKEIAEIPQEEPSPPKAEDIPVPHERKGYAAEEIIAYIDAAYDGNKLKPDNAVEGIPEADCAGIRGYLQSFKLRGKIIVEQVGGVYQVRLDKGSLKKFVALQCSIQRVNQS
jgi:hypothetical protein